MYKLIILLVLLSCSRTSDKISNNTQTANTESDKGSNPSNQLGSLLAYEEEIENKKVQSIYNSVIKGIRPDMPHDSLKKVLQTIHYWDQVYRDSSMEGSAFISDKIKLKKYGKEMSRWDKMNQRIVLYLLNTLGRWPDTRGMGNEASGAIYFVIIHNSNTREFSQQILPFLRKAYQSDSVISNKVYARAYDKVNFKLNGYWKYGTFPFEKEGHPDSVINRINLNRAAIGLDKL